MENPICEFKVLDASSRKYANTVNIVFFRAIPLTKNFQKYVDGLKNWKVLMKKYYPDSQLQVFVDMSIAKDPEIQKVLFSMDARVYLFECPEYLRDDGYHMGLFGTMIRFYPFFDVNTKPMKIAHIQELEPSRDSLPTFEDMNKASLMKFKDPMGIIYDSHNVFQIPPGYKEQATFEDGIMYPWMFAGRFIAMTKIPFSLWTEYMNDVKAGKTFYNKYLVTQRENATIKEHGKYSFGVDESFINEVYLKWLIKNGYGIGFILRYKISYPVYYLMDTLKKDKRTLRILNYILQKNHTSLDRALTDFDDLFFLHEKSKKAKDSAPKFYEIVEKYPDWLGQSQSTLIKKVFDGYLSRTCLVVVKNDTIVEVKDL
jgi:hypothetical protein